MALTLTKASHIVWGNLTHKDNYKNPDKVEYAIKKLTKLEDMKSRNLTDGVYHDVPESLLTGIRHWVDEASAQEWIDFIVQIAAEHNRIITSTEIVNI